MHNACRCIGGQLNGVFSEFAKRLHTRADRLGFYVHSDVIGYGAEDDYYAALDTEWKRVIRARRGEG